MLIKNRSHFKPCVLRFRQGGTEHFPLPCNSKATSSSATSTPPSTCTQARHRIGSTSSTSLMVVGFGRMVPLDSTNALTWLCLPISASFVACELATIPSGPTGRSWLLGSLTAPTVKGLPRVLRGLALLTTTRARRYLECIEARSPACSSSGLE